VDSGAEVSAKRYRYTGKERDDETGLYYYGARYYASWLGRWLSADPSGAVDGLNLYGFVKGNPVRLVDPDGMQSVQGVIDNVGNKLNQTIDKVTEKVTKSENVNKKLALLHAWSVSYLMTGKSQTEKMSRNISEKVADYRNDTNYQKPRVQSVLGGAFLRMYLKNEVDQNIINKVGEEIKNEPNYTKLERGVNSKINALGKKLLNSNTDSLIESVVSKYFNREVSKGLDFKHETNTVIGGVSGVEVKSISTEKIETDNGMQVNYTIDVTFKDEYDFKNKRYGVYENYRKGLASSLAKGDYCRFSN
jgi:RHS repeat-associated protein